MKVRFLADADLNKAIVSGVLRREPSLDFLTAHVAARLRRMTDPEVLALAAEQHRVLVSHDVGTMPAHFRAFRSAGRQSPVCSSSRRASTLEMQSMSSCSRGWHRMHRSGKTGWCGCHCETQRDTRCALEANHGHRGNAARALGISERNFYRKLEEHKLLG